MERARQDDMKRKEVKAQAKLKAAERAENEAPRKALKQMVTRTMEEINTPKNSAKDIAERTNAAGDTYKKGGKVKSASARADGCCIRGKTRA